MKHDQNEIGMARNFDAQDYKEKNKKYGNGIKRRSGEEKNHRDNSVYIIKFNVHCQ